MDGGYDGKMRKGTGYYSLKAIPAALLLLALFIIPIALTFSDAFKDGGAAILGVLTDDYTYHLLSFTLFESLLSAAISVIAALPFASFYSRYSFPGRRAMLVFSQLSFTIPSILVVLGFVIWYGNNGYLNNALRALMDVDYTPLSVLYSFKAIILAHVYLNFPVAFALITASWSSIPDSYEKAAATLGAGRMRTFLRITLPTLRGAVASAFILIFLFCFSSFAIIMVLGGNPAYSTLEVEIYRRVHVDADLTGAAALSLFAFAVNAILLALTTPGRKARRSERKERVLRKARGWRALEALLLSIVMLSFLLPPMISIVIRAFYTRDGLLSMTAWEGIIGRGFGLIGHSLDALLISLIIGLAVAFLATAMASAIAMAAAKRSSRLLPFISSLPMAAGSVTMGLGFIYVSSFISTRLGLGGYALNVLFVIAAHLVIVLPFAVRTITPGARLIPDTLASAAYTLGKGRGRTYRKVEKPMLSPYRRKAFAFSFALSLGEVNATLMLSSGNVETLPVLIYRLISSYDYQGAAALGTLLLLQALIVFAIGEAKGRKNAVL